MAADGWDVSEEVIHDLREGLTLNKGWLETLLRNWHDLDEARRQEMVAGALYGANRVAFILDLLEGKPIEEIAPPTERMVEDLRRLAD